MAQILVFGATGFTGSQIAQELDRRGADFVIAGRNQEKLASLADSLTTKPDIRLASPADPASLADAFAGISVVINTVGPFTDLGEPTVLAALTAGAHYIDTTGEQAFIQDMTLKYDELARRKERVLCCALAFEYALGECAASLACDALGAPTTLLETFYYTRGGQVSRGTAKSMMRAAASPMLAWFDGRHVVEKMGSTTTEVTFDGEERYRPALSFGGGMPLHAPRYGDVREARSFLVMGEDAIRKIRRYRPLAGLLRWGLAQRLADRVVDWRIPHSGPSGSTEVSFRVAARARGAGLQTQVCVSGKDPYGITAVIATEGAIRLEAGTFKDVGAQSAPLIFDAKDFLDALGSHGVTWGCQGGK